MHEIHNKSYFGDLPPSLVVKTVCTAGVSLIPGGEGATIPVPGSVAKNNFFH